MSKKALILYSGGKDSHLALMYALKKGYEPILFNMPGGKKHFVFWSCLDHSDIVKKHFEFMGFENYQKKNSKKPTLRLMAEILKSFSKEIKKSKEFAYFSSNDYQQIKKDKKLNVSIEKLCKTKKVKFVSFKEVIKKDSACASIALSLKNKLDSVIISVDENIDKEWLGKKLSAEFIAMLNKSKKLNPPPDANSYQTLVLSSPLFKGKKIKILSTDYWYDPKDRQHYLKIKKWKILKK